MAGGDRAELRPIDGLVRMLVTAREEMAQLREQLQGRATIGQAQGIVMERLDVDAPGALAYLQRVSVHSQFSLLQLATDTVLTRELPGISSERLQSSATGLPRAAGDATVGED